MPFSKIAVEPSDFDSSGWQAALTDARRPTVDAYAGSFKALSDSRSEKGEDRHAAVLELLSAICYMVLRPGGEEGPYVPMMSGPEGRTLLPEDLSDTEIEGLAHLFDSTQDPELSARLADILWIQKRDHKAAKAAMEAYLESAQRLEDLEEHIHVPVRIERAIDLAALFGGPLGSALQQALDIAASILRARSEAGATIRSLDLLDLLIDRGYGDLSEWATVAEGFAISLENKEDFHPAHMFWARAARAHRRNGNNEENRNALIREAEAYVSLADNAPSEMAKVSFTRSAFEAYRQIPGTEKRRLELHEHLLKHQARSLDEMGTISTPFDLGNAPDSARDIVKEQDLIQALYSLSLLLSPIDPDDLRKQAEQSARDHPFLFTLTSERVNALGRVVGTKPGGFEDPDGAINSMMHDDANRRHQFNVAGIINPARLQILSEHPAVRVEGLEPLVAHNAFVPPDRRLQFAKGIIAGLRGDFLIAALLLIPQIENSLRVTLQRMGVITTGLNSSNRRQNEQSLNVTLYDYKNELEQVFGPDIVFELQSLLVEPMGANLRNEAMHGLMNDEAFFSYPIVYLWWLTTRICCLGNQGPLPEGFSRNLNSSDDTVGEELDSTEDDDDDT